MTQKDKKQKGKRNGEIGRKNGKITKIIKLEYIAEIDCWCGGKVIIDSSKPMIENKCPECNSPYKLLTEEWTPEEIAKVHKIFLEAGLI